MRNDHDTRPNEDDHPGPFSDRLSILLIGNPGSLNDSAELLKSLAGIGFSIGILAAVTEPAPEAEPGRGGLREAAWIDQIRRRMRSDPPDLVIQTADNPELLRRIAPLIPTQTRFVDPFVLKIATGLKKGSGQPAGTASRLRTVELLKEVLLSGPDVSLMVVDEDLEIMEISNAILQRAGMAAEDCIGKHCHWVMKKGSSPSCCGGDHCLAEGVLDTGRSVHTVREGDQDGDSESHFTCSAYPLGIDERGKKNILIVWKDITRGMTEVLNRRARNMRESFSQTLTQDKMAALGRLAAAAVHEINNPIQGILTFSKLMRQSFEKDALSQNEMDKFRSYLDLIAGESQRCGRILRNLLSFARLGNLEKSAFDLKQVLDEVFLLVSHQFKLQGISIDTHIADERLPMCGDRAQIKQALLNLIINSMDAMPDGGTVSVFVGTDSERSRIKIQVSDTGVGIPKYLQSSVWEPFFTTKDVGRGVGLGLSVVYGIITQHGGSVDMQSEENQGTVFTVSLPVYHNAQE